MKQKEDLEREHNIVATHEEGKLRLTFPFSNADSWETDSFAYISCSRLAGISILCRVIDQERAIVVVEGEEYKVRS